MKLPREFESATETYRVDSKLGEGGSGYVLAARDGAGTKVAIKVLAPQFVDGARRKRFSNELSFLQRNKHKNILTVRDHGLAEIGGQKTPFFVMEKFDGTLRHRLVEGISPASKLSAFAQILDGVEAAHLQGVIHRDLKPENILHAKAKNILVVADFGIAHFEEEELFTAVETRASERLANFLYAAPEQRVRGAQVGKPADIYALGLIFNEMFTGRVIQGAGFQKIRDVAAEFSYFDEIVDEMIQQDPARRTSSIEQIKKEIAARTNIAINQQKLDEAKQTVVSKFEKETVEPVTISGGEWVDGQLRVQLNRAPEPGWLRAFANAGNRTYTSSLHWRNVSFQGSTAVFGVESRNAQTAIDLLKGWLTQTTNVYQQIVIDEANRREAEERKRLKAEVNAAEERVRLNSALKF